MVTRAQAVCLVLLITVSAGAATPDGSMDIFFIDVLGGAATLVVTPARESVLIDSGWPDSEDRDPKRIEHVLKTVAGLDHLDHLVTTHWHTDHYGGVAGLSNRVRVDHYWDRGLPDPSAADGDRSAFPDGPKPDDALGIAYRKASEGKRQALKAGDTLPLGAGVEALVLASGTKTIAGSVDAPENPACATGPSESKPDPSDNARSIVLRFRLGKFDFLDCGDLTWDVEKSLVCPVDRVGKIDLFQVTHHGMAISNHPTFLATIAPSVAVMDNGPRKGGDATTVKRLRGVPSILAAYQLHKNAATSDGENTEPALIANKDPKGGEFIRVTVAKDGSSYTVRFGAEGLAREFTAR